jgi:dTDP-4-dehydrorhamnose reductase
MKYLITGYKGQLGYDIKRELISRGVSEENILAIDHDSMDITKREAVMEVILNYKPDIIFHCAAYTAVDAAEDNQDIAFLVNQVGTKNIVDASIKIGAKIIYMSTDYVFDGTKDGLYNETDQVNPKSVYGKTKYLGEEEVRRNSKHYIARISWVFGINGHNFIKTMLQLSENHNELNVVNDQVGSPTYTIDLAKVLVDMSNKELYGTYHVTNEGFCSWAEFAEYIFKINNKTVKVNKVTTEEYLELTKTKQAYRPRNSKLDKSKLENNGFNRLPSWQDATERFCLSLKKEEEKR